MNYTDQLKKLNEGDPVLFYPASYAKPPVKAKVERVTRNRVIVKGVAFDKSKGYACGHGQDPLPPALKVELKLLSERTAEERTDRPMKRLVTKTSAPQLTPKQLKLVAELISAK